MRGDIASQLNCVPSGYLDAKSNFPKTNATNDNQTVLDAPNFLILDLV
jgi:hypothetical protein